MDMLELYKTLCVITCTTLLTIICIFILIAIISNIKIRIEDQTLTRKISRREF